MKRTLIIALLIAPTTACGSSTTVRTVTVNNGTTTAGATTDRPQQLGAVSIMRSLRHAGLPIGGFVSYTVLNDPNHLLDRPGQYVSKVNFRDNRLPAVSGFDTEGGGSIETFKNTIDAKKRYAYVHAITSGASVFAEYEYLRGTVFLRLSKILTPVQAAAYARAFRRIVP